MKQTNKIKGFLTVLATTTALSSGFAVTWGADGKIALSTAERNIAEAEHKKLTGMVAGAGYSLGQFKGALEEKLDTELSHDDFASILDNLKYGTVEDTKTEHARKKEKYLELLKQQPLTEVSELTNEQNTRIKNEYTSKLPLKGLLNNPNYTLGQFKGKIEEIIGRPISLGVFKAILMNFGYKNEKGNFDNVKPRVAAVGNVASQQQPKDAPPPTDYATLFPDPPQESKPYEVKVPTGKSTQAQPEDTHYSEMPPGLKIDLDALATSLSKYLQGEDAGIRTLNNVRGMIRQKIQKDNQHIQEAQLNHLIDQVIEKINTSNPGLITGLPPKPVAKVEGTYYEQKVPTDKKEPFSAEHQPFMPSAPMITEGALNLQIAAGNIVTNLQKQNKPLTQKNASDAFENYNNKSDYLIQNKQEVIRRVLTHQELPSQKIPTELMYQAQQEKKEGESKRTADESSLLFGDPEDSIVSEAVEEETFTQPPAVTSMPAPKLMGRAKAQAEARERATMEPAAQQTPSVSQQPQPSAQTPAVTPAQAPQLMGRAKAQAEARERATMEPAAQQTPSVSQQPQPSAQTPEVTSMPAPQLMGRAKAQAEARAARELAAQQTPSVSQQPQPSAQTPAVTSMPAPQLMGRAKAQAEARERATRELATQQQATGLQLPELTESQKRHLTLILGNIGNSNVDLSDSANRHFIGDLEEYVNLVTQGRMSQDQYIPYLQAFIENLTAQSPEYAGALKVLGYLHQRSQQGTF